MTKTDFIAPIDPSDSFKKLFLQKLRHDLLNAVRPMVEIPIWIEEDIETESFDVPPSLRENLDMLKIYGPRLQQTIADLLTYAHVGRNPETDRIPIAKVIADLTENSLPTGFELVEDLGQDFLPIPVPDQRTLLDALLSNAVKHHDKPSGKIRVTCRKSGNVTQLAVADDGPGIDPKYLETVFDPLTTLFGRDRVEGSGMGLTTVRRIAQLNGGRARAFSTADQRGTCIAVWFP